MDVGRNREEADRRAPNDKRRIDPTCLSYAVLFVDTRRMQNRQRTQVPLNPVYCYLKWIRFCLSFLHIQMLKFTLKDKARIFFLGLTEYKRVFVLDIQIFLKSAACSSATCCAAQKYLSGGRL